MEKVQFPRYPHPSAFLAVSCAIYCVHFAKQAISRGTDLRSYSARADPVGQVHVQEHEQGTVDAAAARFFDYTFAYWHHHAADAQGPGQSVHPFILSFLADYQKLQLPWCCFEHNSALGLAVHFDLGASISSGQLPYDARAFHWAAVNCKITALQALYAIYGSKLRPSSSSQGSAGGMHLHFIVRTGRVDLVEEFLSMSPLSPFLPAQCQLDALINAQDNDGLTPLMVACSDDTSPFASTLGNRLDDIDPLGVLDLLLKFGCDFGVQDNDGLTAFLRAVIGRRIPVPWRRPWANTAPFLNSVLKRLLDFDPTTINQRDTRGRTALMLLAAPGGTIRRMPELLNLVDPALVSNLTNAKDKNGDSVLIHASRSSGAVEWLCANAGFTSTTIRDALIYTFNPANERKRDVARVLLLHASSFKVDLFGDGWNNNLAIVLLAHAVKHPCKHFLRMLLLCCWRGHQAILEYSFKGSGVCLCCHCHPFWSPP